jgi:hypothetical protein
LRKKKCCSLKTLTTHFFAATVGFTYCQFVNGILAKNKMYEKKMDEINVTAEHRCRTGQILCSVLAGLTNNALQILTNRKSSAD